MPNIAILNYCNLKCPYCFANEFIESSKQLITDEQLEIILFWLSHTERIEKIGVIGGEPTIHPNFKNIIIRLKQFASEHSSKICVFSNGIKLSDYIKLFDANTGILININHPDIIGQSNWKQLKLSLNRFKALDKLKYTSIGINLYPEIPDFNYIIDLAKEFNYRVIRCSYVAPTCKYKGVDKNTYYLQAKQMFMDFANVCKENNIDINLDCNNVPVCYFTEDELIDLQHVHNWKTRCEPVVDITPDMKATACFGAYDLVDLNQFDNLEEAENYLLFKKIYPKRIANCAGKCADCKKFQNLSCQGGCLAFV